MRVTFTIPGRPFAKQRHRVSFKQRRTFNTAANESFERTVGEIAVQHFPCPIKGPVRVEIVATFVPAKSWSKKKRAEHLHRPHCQKPDVDNVAKAICDGLNRIAWADDSQIAEMSVRKGWGIREETVVHVEPLVALDSCDYRALRDRLVGGE
ncbi:hypothetical protein DEM26_18115 [Thioclava sp. NG1]|uniref:RusA family crossover junction endodeoxyribonuclease n=1 Tax=Thioclava sp. NG1 TaxID=2182426 RepID=UPI000D604F76|nr:RusA family crossover junction endodeoxyribonuclease [Thioclava sp. NG1]PWE48464.1 hypothetical protein DEM26_18115 [Thioclava sp. NG1]